MTTVQNTTAIDSNHAARSEIANASIPLNKLTAWKGNVRKTAADAQVDELAASIAAHGLLQPLIVRPTDTTNRYEIIAGRRRFLALTLLVSRDQLEPDHNVPCQVIDHAVDAAEISLVENVVRVAMHPADQYVAFSTLASTMSAEAIAARFGVSELTVKKRLALGRVSPQLMQAYRDEDMDLEQLAAFTVTDDHAEQERVWNGVKDSYNDSVHTIRRLLTETDIPATDKRVQFVTMDAYEAAGGVVRRDLFTDGEDGAYLTDARLLNELVCKRLADACQAIAREGWKWVEWRTEFDYDARASFERVDPTPLPLTQEQEAEVERLRKEHDNLCESDAQDAWLRQSEIERQIDALMDQSEFTAEQMAISGALLTVAHTGELEVVRGLVRRGDMPRAEPADDRSNRADTPGTGLPASVIESLTAHKTAIIAAELLKQPDVALAAVVHSLVLSARRMRPGLYGSETCIRTSAVTSTLKVAEGSVYSDEIEKVERKWSKKLPQSAPALWVWCLKQKRETLIGLLAFVAARSVHAVQQKHDQPGAGHLRHANALAAALDIDMAAQFRPTAENFFLRVGKPLILAAFTEATGNPHPPAWKSMKKAELAAAAEREIGCNTAWLPEPVRIGTNVVDGDTSSDEHEARDEDEAA